jgi:hypothetical protein
MGEGDEGVVVTTRDAVGPHGVEVVLVWVISVRRRSKCNRHTYYQRG